MKFIRWVFSLCLLIAEPAAAQFSGGVMAPGFSGVGFGSAGACQQVGGACVGAPGTSGIYTGHILSWGDDFSGALNIVGPSVPLGRYFTTRAYGAGPRGNTTLLGTIYDTDPLTTGYNDSNRGVAVGFPNMSQSGSILTLQARKATAPEQANFNSTDATINGGVRAQVAAMINSIGAVAFYPTTSASVVVEARLKYTTGGPAGWHPTFWTFSATPPNTFVDAGVSGSGSSDEWDLCEGNSTSCLSGNNVWTNGSVGSSANGATSGLYDGNFHTLSIVMVNGANTVVYVDGVATNTFVRDSNTKNKLAYFLITSHIFNGSWNGEAYSQAAWDASANGASILVDWVRVWRPSTAAHWVPLATVPSLNVDFQGNGTIVIPSAASLWGDGSVTEYVQIIPDESNEPGMGVATTYAQFPTGVTYNSGTRTITANFTGIAGNAGVMHGIVYGYKTDGSTAEPARFTINRGPAIRSVGSTTTIGVPVSLDMYPLCDAGILVPKTMSMSSLPAGLSFSPSTFLVTGTPSENKTASVTCTNSLGQAITSNFDFGTFLPETYALLGRFDTLPDSTHQGYIDTAISCLKTNSVWAGLDLYVMPALNTAANGLLNWKGNTFNGTAISSPAFVAYQGYTSNGTTSYIDTHYAISISGTQTQNSVFGSVWSRTVGQDAGSAGFEFSNGTGGFTLNPRNASDQMTFRVNDNTADVVANSNGVGWFTALRDGASSKKAFINGAQVGSTFTTASVNGIPVLDAGIDHSIGSAGFSTRQIATYAFGARHSATDEANIYACTHTYLQNVGAAP